LTRGYLEKITGLITGADGNMNSDLVRTLRDMGFLGEGITDKSTWIVKSHYPDSPGVGNYFVEKCLLIVRNPLDALPSMFNLISTQTHDKSIHQEDFFKFKDIFKEFAE
jgi:hypothetical protein